MSNIEFSFENPLYLLFILPAAAILLFPFFMIPKKRRYTVKRITSLCLHLVLVTVLAFVLAGFSVVKQVNEQAVIFLMDLSHSTESVQESMQTHANELMALIDQNTPIGVVAFGADQIYCVELNSKEKTLSLQTPGVEATDLEQALYYTASLAPSNKALRIVLFTDGKQNEGSAENAAYELAHRGIRLDAIYYDTTYLSTAEVQISALTAPEGVYKNCEATLSAELKSNTDCDAVLKLYENETLLLTQEYAVKAGSNMVEMKMIPQSEGIYTYHLVLEVPNDTVLKNNEAYTYLPVAGQSSVLIIADTLKNARALEAVLKDDNKVTITTAHHVPGTLVELCKYDTVVLSNVYYYALPTGYEKILQEYVGSYGRTLFAVGGSDTFMYGYMEDTLLADMLPVTMSLEGSVGGNSVALMLVLDCSSSMNNGERFVLAKQGAIRCMDAMTDNDYVGIVSFSQSANLESELLCSDNRNKETLTRTISALEMGRGTNYKEALELAKNELEKSDAVIKHILFLSDGQPNDSGYYDVVQEAATRGITVSTIGLGYSSYILDKMADYGAGRYYYVDSAEDLPDIMMSETEQAKVSSLIVGEFVPVIEEQSELTASLQDAELPILTGYLGTALKENATAYLTSEKGHPLYATWKYGFGNVACFTSDLNGTWSQQWLSEDVGKELILGMIKTTVPEVHRETSLLSSVEVSGKSVKISVKTAGSSSSNVVTATVTRQEESSEYTLTQVYPGTYEITLPLGELGVSDLHIVESDSKGNLVDELYTAVAFPYPMEYDEFTESDEHFLNNLCALTKGTIFTDLQALSRVKVFGVQKVYDPIVPLACLIGALLLIDIAVRKIRLKDLKKYFVKKGNRA